MKQYRYGPESAEGKGKNYPRIHNIDVLYSSFTKAQEKLKIVGGGVGLLLSEYQMIRFSPVLCGKRVISGSVAILSPLSPQSVRCLSRTGPTGPSCITRIGASLYSGQCTIAVVGHNINSSVFVLIFDRCPPPPYFPYPLQASLGYHTFILQQLKQSRSERADINGCPVS